MKDKNMSFKESMLLSNRAYSIFYNQCPQLIVSRLLGVVWTSLTPYAGIYLSALIINELSGDRNLSRLKFLVLITLVATALISLVSALLKKWKDTYEKGFIFNCSHIFSGKMLNTDFVNIDNTENSEKLATILKNSNYAGLGLVNCLEFYDQLLSSILTVVGAVSLTVSLFTIPVPGNAGALLVLNSPFVVIAVISVLLLVTFLAPFLRTKADSYYPRIANEAVTSNQLFSFFCSLSDDEPSSMDMRIYRQYKYGCRYLNDKYDVFGSRGMLAHLLRGRMGVLGASSAALSVIFTGVVYIFVCLKAFVGAFGLGSVTQYVAAITKVSGGLSDLFETIGQMINNGPFLKDTFDYLDTPDNMYQGSLTVEKRRDRKYQVEFKNVSFKYPGSDNWVLRNVNVGFEIGKRLAVVGMNGSGKTTFIKLLCRLYDPTEGEILLNGIDIRKYNYREYMDIFSVVFQDFKLMSLKLGENVASCSNYDKERIVDCLAKAGFSDRLRTLKDGVDTYLYKDFNSEGVNVSGGEAQKIAIARSLYKNSPFIILDEPTAALDPIAEAEIYGKFNDIAGDKTAIYISHRLSSCKFCDKILVFNAGEVVQSGTHEELVYDENGKYYELWHAQAQYYSE